MLPQWIRRLLKAAFSCCWLALPAAVSAVDVEIRVSDQISATADFRPGKTGKPAILILHGFLQTREFGIIKNLMDELASAGYTVLSPTLSLGISYRKSSLNCEALHLHDMEGDIKEIQQWVQWLRTRGYGNIVGLGHSFGATQLLAWREQYHERGVDLIGISLASSAPLVLAPKQKASGQKKPQTDLLQAPLSFCEIYTAPASKYTSYFKWNDQKILGVLQSSKATTDVILGSEDKYLPPSWKSQLAKAGAKVHLIKNANHFMEGPPEFDMFDATLGILKR